MPGDRGIWELPGKPEIQGEAAPLQTEQDDHRAAILIRRFFSGSARRSRARTYHFGNEPDEASPKEYRGGDRVRIDQWEHSASLSILDPAGTPAETGRIGKAFPDQSTA